MLNRLERKLRAELGSPVAGAVESEGAASAVEAGARQGPAAPRRGRAPDLQLALSAPRGSVGLR